MSLGRALDQRLAPGMAPGPVQVRAPDGSAAEVDVVEIDRLGASIRGVRVEGSEPGDITGQAERLPDALRSLPERIVPVEVAPALGGAVLRTEPREVRDREYFEVRTNGREATLERMRGKERVPFTMTRDELRRIIDRVGEAMPEPREG